MSTHVIIQRRISILATLLVAWLIAGLSPSRLSAQATSERTVRPLANDFTQKAIRRLIAGNGYAAHSFGFRPFVRPAITDDNWLGGSGTWSTAASWSLGTVPGSGNNANITTSGSTVTFTSGGNTINNLTVGSSDVLSFSNNNQLVIAGTTITNSNSTGSGGLQFNSINNFTGIEISSSAVSLTGGGTITMSANTANIIYGAVSADVFTNVNNTIQGSGQIGLDQMGLNNQGTIDANQSAATLTIRTSSGTTNSGTLEATAGGNLILDGDTYTNTGTILASGTNSVVTLENPTINGGKLNGTSGGQIQVLGTSTVLNGVTNLGTLVLPNNQQATIEGTIVNNGNIQFNSINNVTGFAVFGATTLTGGGTITMTDNNANFLYNAAAGASLTNVNNTISGSGNIGDGALQFTNDANGVVDAVSAHGNTLLITTGTAGATNLGLMEASSGGLLEFENTTTNTNGTINGTIEALNGGEVLLNAATIIGGTLTTAGTGVIVAQSGSELNGSTNTVTNAGNLQIPNNNSLLFAGTINNTGTIASNSINNTTGLELASAAGTLSGTGSITFSDNNNNYIYSQTGGNQLTLSQPLSGPGGNIGDGNTVITNQSTIDATASAHGNTLTIQPDGTFTNNGTLEATGGGSLALFGGTFTNTTGTITAGSGSTVALEGSVTVAGGTLNGAGVFVSESGSTLDGSAHNVNLSSTTFEIPNNTITYFKGTLNNTGTIELQSINNDTELQLNSATGTLQGAGTITFSDNNNNYIFASTGGNQLTIAQEITGAGGNVGDGDTVITNQSTIDATASAHGNTLTIQPDGTFTNNSLIEATGGGSLALDGGTFLNTNGTITAGSGSTVALEGSATVTGGHLNGAGTFVLDANSTLNGITSASLIELPNNTTSFLEGTITNNGTLQVNSINNNTILAPVGSVTLTGGGALTLSDNNNNYVENGASGSLTNVNNTISGSGNIGDGGTAFTNDSAGVVDATSTHGNTLTINSGSTGASNAGLWEASSGGTMLLEGTINNAGGTIEGLAGTGSSAGGSVVINGANITGGTLNTLGTGVNASSMTAEAGAILNGVTNDGTIGIPNNTNAELKGTVTNNGAIDVNSINNETILYINGNTTLNGTGTITLSNNANNYMFGVADTEVLTNNGNTIEGSGNIGDGTLGLINNASGTILANQPNALIIQPNASGLTNNGTLEVNTGSLMNIVGTGALTNFNSTTNTLTGGTYNMNGGELEFVGANIVNNAADIILTGAGQIVNSSNSANALANFAVNQAGGTFQLGAGHNFTTAGTFTNNGLLIVGAGDTFDVSNGNLTNFASSTLTGGGYFVAGTLEFGASGTGITTNDANITLSTAGWSMINLGSGNLLTNLATNDSGANFNVENGASFTTAGAFSNSGTMDVENGGTLKVAGALTNNGTVSTNGNNQGGAANTLTVTGTLTNGATDTVAIGENNDTSDVAKVGILANSGTVTVGTGATLNLTSNGANTNSGSITVTGGTLDMQAGSLTNSSTMDEEKGASVTITGNLTNNGAITTNNANLGGAANTLTVTGTLTNNTGDSVTIGAHSDTSDTASVGILTNNGTVTVDHGGSLHLTGTGTDTNTGTITVSNGTLTLATTADLDMEKGGSLAVTGALTNAGEITTNEANMGGSANTVSVSGKVTNNSGASITIGANNDTADTGTFGTLANSGTVTVGTGATLTLSGATTNTNPGTLAVDGTLDSKGSITLTGTGTLTLSAGTVADTGTNKTLTVGAHNTVSGSGTISGFGVTNSGTLSANQSSPLIFLPDSAGLTNNGTIKVSAGDTMEIGTSAGGALTNLSGTTLTGGIYNLTGTLEFGSSGTTIATNAANITLTGAGEMKDFGGNNILAGFNNNSSTGVFKLATGASLLTTGGSFTNAGTFTISTGTTFTIGGSGFNYTQTGGSTTVAGTLTSTSLGTVNLDAGTLTGAGTIGDNLVDDSTLDPGTSAARTGKLTVTDTYTQDAGGSLNIQINGATAVTKYDQLKVTGSATLGGTLNIDLGSFTPTVGQTFTILTASSVADQFATVNGLAINGSEHFTITYDANKVVLTVVSGPQPSASPSLITAAVHPTLYRGAVIGRGSAGGHYGLALNTLRMARTPVTSTVAASMPSSLAPAFRLAHVPAASSTLRPVTMPVTLAPTGMGRHGFHAMDDFGSPVAASSAAGDAGVSSGIGISSVGAEAYNPMGSMNHMRFELGVDMKALMKTSRKQLVRALWASPDSPEALSIGYLTFTGSH